MAAFGGHEIVPPQSIFVASITKLQNHFIFQRSRRSSILHPCSHGENWCDNPPDYPQTFIRQAINSSHPLWSLLKQNSKPQLHQHHHHHRQSHRQPRILQEASRPACELVETFVRPRAARNRELEWRFIVNDLEEDTEYQQVRIAPLAGVKM